MDHYTTDVVAVHIEHAQFDLAVVDKQPVTGSQLSVVQTLPSLQVGGVPGVHVPP